MDSNTPKNNLLKKSNAELIEIILSQSAKIDALVAEVNELKDRIAKNSHNSSRPPSTDGYEKPAPKSRREKSGKKVGGQPGHEGTTLEMIDTPDAVEHHTVEICKNCGRDISDIEPDGHECRQEVDIEPETAVVTEHRAENKTCPFCGYINTGEFPGHLTKAVQYGANIKARANYFNQYHFIPYDRLQQVFQDCYSLSISTGSFVNFNKQCAQNVAPAVTAIKSLLIDGEVIQFDESGMRVRAKLHWLHVASNERLTYYDIHQKRGQEAIDDIDILPEFKKTAIHDHWKPYLTYGQCEHGLCNAHHIRELEFIVERYKQRWAKKLIDFLLEVKNEVEDHKDRGRKKLSEKLIRRYERKYNRILSKGLAEIPELPKTEQPKRGRKKQHKARNLWDRLYHYKRSVLLFMYDFKVPFTNNLAEQDIRMCKVKGKVSGGFRSERGSKAFCSIRSYISTARKQGENALTVLKDAFLGRPFIPT